METGTVYTTPQQWDPVTFRTEHEIVAVAVCLEVFRGDRELLSPGGQLVCPQLNTSDGFKDDHEAYFRRRFGKKIGEVIHTKEFIKALNTMLYCTQEERRNFEISLRYIETEEQKKAYFDKINSTQRTKSEDPIGHSLQLITEPTNLKSLDIHEMKDPNNLKKCSTPIESSGLVL